MLNLRREADRTDLPLIDFCAAADSADGAVGAVGADIGAGGGFTVTASPVDKVQTNLPQDRQTNNTVLQK